MRLGKLSPILPLMQSAKLGNLSSILNLDQGVLCKQAVLVKRRRVDVDAVYDRNSYRPSITSISGKPMFLS